MELILWEVPLSKAQVLGLCYDTLIHRFNEKLSNIGYKTSFDFENSFKRMREILRKRGPPSLTKSGQIFYTC
jgi:hypothetical protein